MPAFFDTLSNTLAKVGGDLRVRGQKERCPVVKSSGARTSKASTGNLQTEASGSNASGHVAFSAQESGRMGRRSSGVSQNSDYRFEPGEEVLLLCSHNLGPGPLQVFEIVPRALDGEYLYRLARNGVPFPEIWRHSDMKLRLGKPSGRYRQEVARQSRRHGQRRIPHSEG